MTLHCYTSVIANYIPKARVLAHSVKRHQPDARFHLLLSDRIPEGLDLDEEPFDSIITIEELGIPDLRAWIFRHTIVELCTAVKGIGAQEIARREGARKIIYFDPDIVVFDTIESLDRMLDGHGILLTPHQTEPEEDRQAIIDNEMCSLKHGTYNLGFVALNLARADGKRFLDWWSRRLLDWCYADIPRGLFTDQKWVDLAPAFFDDLLILREPQYNVATWNLTHRKATGSMEEGVRINGKPLCFYHFSGFDSGAQEIMLNRYMGESVVLKDLREWYIEECERQGQSAMGSLPFSYGTFDNGEPITTEHRLLYRSRLDLQRAFVDPFDTRDIDRSYYDWYRVHVAGNRDGSEETVESLRNQLAQLRERYELMQRSRIWRWSRPVARIAHRFGF